MPRPGFDRGDEGYLNLGCFDQSGLGMSRTLQFIQHALAAMLMLKKHLGQVREKMFQVQPLLWNEQILHIAQPPLDYGA